jgi:hypothetical protein
MFSIVFRVRYAIFICVPLNSFVILLVSFPLYVNVDHFVFCCLVLCLGVCVLFL